VNIIEDYFIGYEDYVGYVVVDDLEVFDAGDRRCEVVGDGLNALYWDWCAGVERALYGVCFGRFYFDYVCVGVLCCHCDGDFGDEFVIVDVYYEEVCVGEVIEYFEGVGFVVCDYFVVVVWV